MADISLIYELNEYILKLEYNNALQLLNNNKNLINYINNLTNLDYINNPLICLLKQYNYLTDSKEDYINIFNILKDIKINYLDQSIQQLIYNVFMNVYRYYTMPKTTRVRDNSVYLIDLLNNLIKEMNINNKLITTGYMRLCMFYYIQFDKEIIDIFNKCIEIYLNNNKTNCINNDILIKLQIPYTILDLLKYNGFNIEINYTEYNDIINIDNYIIDSIHYVINKEAIDIIKYFATIIKYKTESYVKYKDSLLYKLINKECLDAVYYLLNTYDVYCQYKSDKYININYEYITDYPLINIISNYNKYYRDHDLYDSIIKYYLEHNAYYDKLLITYIIKYNKEEHLLKTLNMILDYNKIDLKEDNIYKSYIYRAIKHNNYCLIMPLLNHNIFYKYKFDLFRDSLMYYVINGKKNNKHKYKYLTSDKFYSTVDVTKLQKGDWEKQFDNGFDYDVKLNNKLQLINRQLIIEIVKFLYNNDDQYNIEMLKCYFSKQVVNQITEN